MKRAAPIAKLAVLASIFAAFCAAPAFAGTVCPKGAVTQGVDVSKWQGTINWTKVLAGDVHFVIARVSDGTYLDVQFDSYWKALESAGVVRGAYQFFEPATDPIVQADILLSKMGPMKPGVLPPTLDVEAAGGKTPAQVEAAVKQWIDYVSAKLGVTPIIYTGAWFWDPSVASSAQSKLPLWTSNYCSNCCAKVPTAWTDWLIWQWGDTGTVAGISGACDMDEFNGDLAALQAYVSGGASSCVSVMDTLADAKAITSNNAYSGTACATGDTDYFSWSGCGAFSSQITANQSSFDCACAILDGSGKELVQGGAEGYVRNDNFNGASGCACSLSQGDGSFYLKIFASSAGNYTFAKTIPPAGPCACKAMTCADYPSQCGSALSDGCGATLDCSKKCAAGQVCNAGSCEAPCAKATCASLGVQCGTWNDGCGGSLVCPACGSATTCDQGSCKATPPSTCQACPTGNECQNGESCRHWDGTAITFCAASCAGGSCPAGTICTSASDGFWCLPSISQACKGSDVWYEDACGNFINVKQKCSACSAGTCSSPACKDECTGVGSVQCNGNGVQTCGQYDADSCLEWSSAISCPSGQLCSAGTCVTSASCGNKVCDPLENAGNCCWDCACDVGMHCTTGGCAGKCGDGICAKDENCSNCWADCPCSNGGTCQGGTCETAADAGSSPADAATTPGDAASTPADAASTPGDGAVAPGDAADSAAGNLGSDVNSGTLPVGHQASSSAAGCSAGARHGGLGPWALLGGLLFCFGVLRRKAARLLRK